MEGKGFCPFLYDESHIPHNKECLKKDCELWVPDEEYYVLEEGYFIRNAHCSFGSFTYQPIPDEVIRKRREERKMKKKEDRKRKRKPTKGNGIISLDQDPGEPPKSK